jgi:dihydropteroate synthase
MSILNVTPDSFSDGGKNAPSDLEALKHTIRSHISGGATIIDIGGQSSRPNAPDITAEEEISRILPAIEAVKSLPEATHISISVDTYRASVAEAAVNAGAHIVNDISAGLLDPDMLSTVARLKCTYIMMHMRGTPATMQSPENMVYPHGLVSTIKNELLSRLLAAQQAGIRRWNIILDPGIGFAKTAKQNVELLRDFGKLRDCAELRAMPWLVGSSRKGFIGQITGTKIAADRVMGTAVTVARAVEGGAEIVRVHDIEAMTQVVRMAEAMYRGVYDLEDNARKKDGQGNEAKAEAMTAEVMPIVSELSHEAEPMHGAAGPAKAVANDGDGSRSEDGGAEFLSDESEAAVGPEPTGDTAELLSISNELGRARGPRDEQDDLQSISVETLDGVEPEDGEAQRSPSSQDQPINEPNATDSEADFELTRVDSVLEVEPVDEGAAPKSSKTETADEMEAEVGDAKAQLTQDEPTMVDEAESKEAEAESWSTEGGSVGQRDKTESKEEEIEVQSREDQSDDEAESSEKREK